MTKLNRDLVIAILALAGCGILGWESLSIRDPGYGTLAPAVWPQLVLAALTIFSAIYFFQSLALPAPEPDPYAPRTIGAFLDYYRNPIICYLVYFVFLITLPIFGALIGGILLVFVLLNVLGGWSPPSLLKHGLIALVSMGFMWSLFTFGLRVILPEGMIFSLL